MALSIMMKRVINSNGFTLIELLIVIAIIGIVGVIATPNILSWTNSRSIQTDLAAIKARIEYARAVSVAENRQAKVLLLAGVMQVRIYDSDTPTNINSACSGSDLNNPNEYAEDYNFTATVSSRQNHSGQTSGRNFVPAPTDSAAYSRNSGTLCFNSDGTSSSGGFLLKLDNPWLENDHPMKTEKYRIDVFKTGFYSVERYVPNSSCTTPNCWAEAD